MVDRNKAEPLFERGKDSCELNGLENEVVLVKLAQQGNQDAFARLRDDHYRKIIQYLIPKVGCDNADDVAQETFIKVWNKLSDLHSPKFFNRYIRKVANNCAIDYWRRNKKHQAQVPLDTQMASGDRDEMSIPGPEESVERSELIELALRQVPLLYRSVLILYVRKGLSQGEIAKRLNIEEASVGSYISRGKREFWQNYIRLLGE